jgi:hypothetical protein
MVAPIGISEFFLRAQKKDVGGRQKLVASV